MKRLENLKCGLHGSTTTGHAAVAGAGASPDWGSRSGNVNAWSLVTQWLTAICRVSLERRGDTYGRHMTGISSPRVLFFSFVAYRYLWCLPVWCGNVDGWGADCASPASTCQSGREQIPSWGIFLELGRACVTLKKGPPASGRKFLPTPGSSRADFFQTGEISSQALMSTKARGLGLVGHIC